jgi:hypothetical protein
MDCKGSERKLLRSSTGIILYLPGGAEENHKGLSQHNGCLVEVHTKHFPHAIYRYVNLVGFVYMKSQREPRSNARGQAASETSGRAPQFESTLAQRPPALRYSACCRVVTLAKTRPAGLSLPLGATGLPRPPLEIKRQCDLTALFA